MIEKKYFKTPEIITRLWKYYKFVLIGSPVISTFVIFASFEMNRNNHFNSAGEFAFQQVVMCFVVSMGVFVMFACAGRIVIQILVWRTYFEDVHLKRLGFLAIAILLTSFLMALVAFKIFSISCSYAPFSFNWKIESFFYCILTVDVVLAGGFWLLEYLQKMFGIGYLPNK